MKKILSSFFILIAVFVTGIMTMILYPQPLFANKIEYKQFNIYSNVKIIDEIKSLLDSTISLVKISELYDSTYQIDIFLSYNTFFNNLDGKIFGYVQAARQIDNNMVIKVAVDINNNLAYPTFPKPCKIDFTYLLAHEMMHCLQFHKYGLLKFNPVKPPPMWKEEGYPEYIAMQKFFEGAFSLKKEIKRFIELKNKQTNIWFAGEEGECDVHEVYYKGRLMTEYLMNVVHLSYDQILEDTRSEEEIYIEMTGWANRD